LKGQRHKDVKGSKKVLKGDWKSFFRRIERGLRGLRSLGGLEDLEGRFRCKTPDILDAPGGISGVFNWLRTIYWLEYAKHIFLRENPGCSFLFT
jgi:hypothetical protein